MVCHTTQVHQCTIKICSCLRTSVFEVGFTVERLLPSCQLQHVVASTMSTWSAFNDGRQTISCHYTSVHAEKDIQGVASG
jgi:hypothetical protein